MEESPMTNAKDKAAEPGAEGVAAQASEGMLGPNPFIGLRPQDLLSTVGNIGGQALKQPILVLEQQAALARDLISVLSGNAEIAPSGGDKRFIDAAWKDNPFYRMSLQGYLAWSSALTLLCQISVAKSGCFCKQHGHLGRATTRAAVRQRRTEAMECGT
jgi:polyhydroxyalkanoate synthase subunit PhaC